MIIGSREFVSSYQGAYQTLMEPVHKSHRNPFERAFVARAEMVIQFSAHAKDPIFNPTHGFVFGGHEPATRISPDRRDEQGQPIKSENEHSNVSLHRHSPPFFYPNKMYHILGLLLAVSLLGGCAAVSDLGFQKPKNIPPEFRQKVGLYVHDTPEKFFYPGTARLDVSDLMSFHLQQTLPFTSQSALQEIFSKVELSEEGPKIQFKTPDLAGYFEIKIASARYDWPDPNATKYRAEIQLLVEFKTFEDRVIWNDLFTGEGVGFSDPNIRLTRFGRDAATALEDAFQGAIYGMQDAVLKSPDLKAYFSSYAEEHGLNTAGATQNPSHP